MHQEAFVVVVFDINGCSSIHPYVHHVLQAQARICRGGPKLKYSCSVFTWLSCCGPVKCIACCKHCIQPAAAQCSMMNDFCVWFSAKLVVMAMTVAADADSVVSLHLLPTFSRQTHIFLQHCSCIDDNAGGVQGPLAISSVLCPEQG